MNSDILKGKWKQLKGSARQKWGELTNDDLDQIQGNGQKLIGKLQERYGYSREWAEHEMNEFMNSWNDTANADTSGRFGENTKSTAEQHDHELSSDTHAHERSKKRRAS